MENCGNNYSRNDVDEEFGDVAADALLVMLAQLKKSNFSLIDGVTAGVSIAGVIGAGTSLGSRRSERLYSV